MHSQQKTLAFALTATSSRRWALTLAGAVAFTAATAAAAHVRIPLPFSPVPVTMQTMVVLLAGATLTAIASQDPWYAPSHFATMALPV